MNEYDVQDPYGTYDVGDELKPYEILNQMKSWDKEIRLTVSSVQLGLDGTIQQQAQILLDLDSINLSVVNIDSRLGTAESTIDLQAGEIALKATQAYVDGINTRVTSAELNIDGLNAEILLKANSSITDGLNTRLGSAEINIDGLSSEISLKADASVTNALDTRLGSAEVFISGVDAKINAKADALVTDGLNARLGTAELDIDGLQAEIALKATLLITDGLNTRVGTAETNISGLTSSINSKASTTVTDALGTRVNTAEQNINGLNASISQKVSQTDYTGNTIMSMFNQTATTIKMLAKNIDLTGIVRVADSIELGLSSNGMTKAIKFNGTSAWIYSDASNLVLDTSFLNIRAYTSFYQGVDFQNNPIYNVVVPTANYAYNAGTLQNLYASDFSRSGHDHGSAYIKPYTGQNLQLWRNGTKIRVYDLGTGGYTELTGITG